LRGEDLPQDPLGTYGGMARPVGAVAGHRRQHVHLVVLGPP
jgi:hypothetical protein